MRPSRDGLAMLLLIVLTCLIAGVQIAAAAELAGKPGALGYPDYVFAGETDLGDQFQIDSGKLALRKSATPAVRAYADEMVSSHEKVKAQLASLLQSKSAVQPPLSLLQSGYTILIDSMKPDDPKTFDHHYAVLQLEYQIANDALFRWEIANSKDQDFIAYAKTVLVEIDKHLDTARELAKK